MTTPLTAEQIERRKELAAVLRAGEYKRGSGLLQEEHRAEHYCCLGVACRVAEQHGIAVVVDDDARLRGATLYAHQPDVGNYYGFTAIEQSILADMDDQIEDGKYLYSWDEIAAHIETGDLR